MDVRTAGIKDGKGHTLAAAVIVHTLETTSDYWLTKNHRTQYRSALHKNLTLSKLTQLIDVCPDDRKKGYWRTYHCNNVLLQNGYKLKGSLCRKRWCQTCCRIKTAEMTNGYKEPLLALGDLHFVTLSRPNVKGRQLRSEVQKMIKGFQRIKDNLRKNYKVHLNGIRKIEVTYNKTTDDYHPHFHFIQQGRETSQLLLDMWLQQFDTANVKGQNITVIDTVNENSFIELFKYATKDIVKDKTTAAAQDQIYKSLESIRIYQTYGKIRKVKPPKEEKTEIVDVDWIPAAVDIWQYDNKQIDYLNAADDKLIGTLEIRQRILDSQLNKPSG